MLLKELLDLGNLHERARQGYIQARRHPVLALTLLCYTRAAQLEWEWDKEIMQCRGLIVDDNGVIVARPFPKFGTYEQHISWTGGQLPQGHFTAFDKLDGSLGIAYPGVDGPAMATKGSFESEQAAWATEWLQRQPVANFDFERYTYLFEIIYPENRVVVDYGDIESCVLLDVLEIETGQSAYAEQQRLASEGWAVVSPVQIDYSYVGSLAELYKQVPDDVEGFVLRYDNGTRLKVKGERYLELHKLKEGLTPRRMLQYYLERNDEWLADLPDEFMPEAKAFVQELERHVSEIRREITSLYVRTLPLTRKEFAQKYSGHELRSMVFLERDGRTDALHKQAVQLAYERMQRDECTE